MNSDKPLDSLRLPQVRKDFGDSLANYGLPVPTFQPGSRRVYVVNDKATTLLDGRQEHRRGREVREQVTV